MANRRYRSSQPRYMQGYVPEFPREEIDYFEEAIRNDPRLQSSFDYSQLDEKYPVKSIAGRIQLEEQRRSERPYLEEDIAYRTNLIKDKQAELGLKKAARDLDMYESQINREDAMLEQIPIARQKLAELDVRDPNFINKAYDIQDEHPMAFESQEFQKYVFQPMLNRNSRLSGRRQEGIITQAEAKQAMDEIMKYETLKENTYPDEEHTPELQKYLGIQQNTLNQFYSQRGMANPMGATAPQQGGISPQPVLAPSVEDSDTATARRLLLKRPELKDEINRRLISAGKPPIE